VSGGKQVRAVRQEQMTQQAISKQEDKSQEEGKETASEPSSVSKASLRGS